MFNIFLLLIAFSSSALAISPHDIVKNADAKRNLGGSFSLTATVTEINGDENKTSVFEVKVKDIDTSLVEQSKPERSRGRKLLMKEYDMWLFTKDIKRPVRIGLEQKLTGEVSNGDLAKTNYAEDYDATLDGEEMVDGVNCYKLSLKAKNKKVTYSKITYFVEKSKFYPKKAYFFAISGKQLKTAYFKDLKTVLGSEISTGMEIVDNLNKEKKSIISNSNHKKTKFDESVFNKENLEIE